MFRPVAGCLRGFLGHDRVLLGVCDTEECRKEWVASEVEREAFRKCVRSLTNWHPREPAMTYEIRKPIVRPATPEEKARHQLIRQQIEEELPEIQQWARQAAAQHQERVAVGTVL